MKFVSLEECVFLKRIAKIHPHLEVVSKFTKTTDRILVKNEFGICDVVANMLLCGSAPTIRSAINKKEYVIGQFKKIHKDKYDYSKIDYVDATTKVEIVCKLHGSFMQNPNKHLNKRGCPICGRIIVDDSAKRQATGWKYSDWENAGNLSKNFDCFKFYICKLESNEEIFYKVGKTFNTFIKRFDKHNIKYKITELYSQCGSALHISRLENYLKSTNKEHKYLPKQVFGGMYECFSEINDLEEIISNPAYWDKVFLK